MEAARLGVEVRVDPVEAVHLFRNLLAELLDLRRIIAAKGTPEVESAYVE